MSLANRGPDAMPALGLSLALITGLAALHVAGLAHTMSIKDEIAAINRDTARIRAIRQEIEAMSTDDISPTRSDTWTLEFTPLDVFAVDGGELRGFRVKLLLEEGTVRYRTPSPHSRPTVRVMRAWRNGEYLEPASWLFRALDAWAEQHAGRLIADRRETDAAEADRMASYRYYLED